QKNVSRRQTPQDAYRASDKTHSEDLTVAKPPLPLTPIRVPALGTPPLSFFPQAKKRFAQANSTGCVSRKR
ncbi:hypothetical protein NE619_13955, partial [Anaerovorax odorimutans]